jgi:hypothetical protein
MKFNTVLNSVDPATREEIERLHAVVRRCKVEQQPLSSSHDGDFFREWD